MDRLPSELIPLIGIHLTLRDLLTWALISKRYYRLCRQPKLLKQIEVSSFNPKVLFRYPSVDPTTGQLVTNSIPIVVCTTCRQPSLLDSASDHNPKCHLKCDWCREFVCRKERSNVSNLVVMEKKKVKAMQNPKYLCRRCLDRGLNNKLVIAYRDCWDQPWPCYLSSEADKKYRVKLIRAGYHPI